MGCVDDTKSFVPFQGFALCVCVWWKIFPRAGSRISATTPAAPARWQAEKDKIKKPPLAIKKARLFAGTKNEYIICAISFHGAYIKRGSDIYNPPSLS